MRLRFTRQFRDWKPGAEVDVADTLGAAWVRHGVAECTDIEPGERHLMRIRFTIDIDGPVGTYDAGDELEVVEHFGEAWIEAGIAELADATSSPSGVIETAITTGPESAAIEPPKPRTGRTRKPVQEEPPPPGAPPTEPPAPTGDSTTPNAPPSA